LGSEILIAELGKPLLKALLKQKQESLVVQKDLCGMKKFLKTYKLQSGEFKIEYTFEEIEQVSGTEEWEKNFEPIDVDGKCHVRAPFHLKRKLNLIF
jgi:ribosomal protein L11 methyltransferase